MQKVHLFFKCHAKIQNRRNRKLVVRRLGKKSKDRMFASRKKSENQGDNMKKLGPGRIGGLGEVNGRKSFETTS